MLICQIRQIIVWRLKLVQSYFNLQNLPNKLAIQRKFAQYQGLMENAMKFGQNSGAQHKLAIQRKFCKIPEFVS